ncbi:MAG: DUF523 domain-containing protein [Thermodesulfobacteriota bacterium]
MAGLPESGPVLVSACLCGLPCRYDGSVVPLPAALDLVRQGRAIPVCPEQLGGLPTPRPAIELRQGRAYAKDGRDLTEEVARGAQASADLARLAGCWAALLKARSPTCGSGRIYDGTFSGRLVPGDGMLAALLREQGLVILSDEDLG